MLTELEKSKLCKTCGKCCQCLVLPVVRPNEMNKAVMEDWLDARGCEVVRETKDNLFVKFAYPCPHLHKSDKNEYLCEMYHKRPEGCRIFDGSVYDFLDCAWKKAETRYVIDLRKSRTMGSRDKKKRKDRFYNRYSKLKGRMSEGKAFAETKKEE